MPKKDKRNRGKGDIDDEEKDSKLEEQMAGLMNENARSSDAKPKKKEKVTTY